MTTNENSADQQSKASLGKRMLIGAGIGLAVISYFLIGSGGGLPEWGKYWMIQPLIVGPFAGAMGGLCNYILMTYHHLAGVNRTVAMILSVIIFLVGMWMGIVLGFHGTMWN